MFKYIWLIIILSMAACKDENSILPKPRMYPKIDFPEKDYKLAVFLTCPFEFEQPSYATIVKDNLPSDEGVNKDCWFDMRIDTLQTSLYCSYVEITKENNLDKLINDAFNIAGKHNIKANARKESVINTENGIEGLLFEIDGPVATPIQFYLTDSKKHFFRASLYFNAKVNPDSTAPILKFVSTDIEKMLETFRWK